MGRKPDPSIRERIIKEAEHVLHLRGYHGTTLDVVAEACGMSKANLLHHYGSKEELGLAVLDAKIADYRRRRVEPLCADCDPRLSVGRMFAEAAKFYRGNGCKAGCFVANIALEMADVNDAFRERAGRFFAEWTRGLSECLLRGRAAGRLEPDLNPKAAAESIISLYEGAVMLARTSRDASVFDRVGRTAQSILQQQKIRTRRAKLMGPKTPCGC